MVVPLKEDRIHDDVPREYYPALLQFIGDGIWQYLNGKKLLLYLYEQITPAFALDLCNFTPQDIVFFS